MVEDFARALGSGVHAVDGSGLTRSNRASPRQVVDLLLAMRDDPAGDDFIQDLALTGKEGTVDDRMHGTAAYGRCRTKTGTLTGVSNLSGYCFNKSGRIMVFSILMDSVGDLGLAHLAAGPDRRPRRRLLIARRRRWARSSRPWLRRGAHQKPIAPIGAGRAPCPASLRSMLLEENSDPPQTDMCVPNLPSQPPVQTKHFSEIARGSIGARQEPR